MTFIEFLGFVISMILIFFIMMRSAWQESQRKGRPKRDFEPREGEDLLREFLQSLEEEGVVAAPKRPEVPPPPPPEEEEEEEPEKVEVVMPQPRMEVPHRTVGKRYHFHSDLADYKRKKTSIEKRQFIAATGKGYAEPFRESIVSEAFRGISMPELRGEELPPRAKQLLHRTESPQDILLLHEIIAPPIALRHKESDYR